MNGVQGVASSNLVIPTRISGSCDKFFPPRPLFPSCRLFACRRGLSESPRSSLPRAHSSFCRNTAGSPRVRLSPVDASFLACFFLRSLVRQPRWLRKSQPRLQERGGRGVSRKMFWGNFPRRPKRFGRTAQLLKKSRSVGETGIFGRQSPALPGTLSPAVGTRFPRASMQPICDGEHARIGTDTIAFELFFFDCIFIFLQTFYKHVRR